MSYDSFNKTDLVAMQSMQESEFPRYTVAMAHTHKNGFWTLQSDSIFYMENGWDFTEFSIV
ncbi:hypothetical protein [Acinetobacter bereziniae]|uniref:hypothetical protein n=1 Tax=Acinetobacter bereziniae TaxID=106648 RepID=UPI0024803F49|nr:hypothetical protein [Acinetobacter bereziniae]